MQDLIVFGRGFYANKKWNDIKCRYNIRAVLDNNVDIEDSKNFKGVKVYTPNEFLQLKEYPILIMIWDYADVVIQLRNLGVNLSQIWIWNADTTEGDLGYFKADEIENIKKIPQKTIQEDWGGRRGTPIGRVYISKFLEENRHYITGDIMEVGDSTYSKLYSVKSKTKSYTAINVEDKVGCIKADLETGIGLKCNQFDTMIITQTLAYIYDLKAVVRNIYKTLKYNGYCFVTVTDIGHMGELEQRKYGTYWGFHKDGCKKLFSEFFGENNVNVKVYGNIKSIVAEMYGLAAEDLEKEEIDKTDERYPMIIGVVAHKV